jgi:adenylate cyclase
LRTLAARWRFTGTVALKTEADREGGRPVSHIVTESKRAPGGLLQELKRRRVTRVAAVYVTVSLGVIYAADAILPNVGLPDWTVTLVIILVGLGLPLALGLAWAFDVTPDGVVRTEPRATQEPLEAESDSTAVGPNAARDETRKSIVVLPFDNMSPDPADAYFSDGLTEEIITQLSHLRSLRVISRSSAMVFKATPKDVRTIGQELGVQFVLEGSVRKAGNDLRITAQLIDAESDEHLWTQSYDRELRQIFDTQSEIALNVADQLRASLDPTGEERIRAHPTQSLDAHDSYLLGKQHWWTFTPEGLGKAKRHLERAIELDPSYADAHAGLASMYLVAGGGGVNLFSTADAMGLARSSAERAIALDPFHGEAYGTLGLVQCWYYWEWEKAEDSVRRGVEVDPNSSHAWGSFAHVMDALGKHSESTYGSDRFVELDPLQQVTLNNASIHYCHAGRLTEAMEFAQRSWELHPESWMSAYAVAYVHLCTGEYDKAMSYLDPVKDQLRATYAASILAYLLARVGREKEFEAEVTELKVQAAEGRATWTEVAVAYMGADDAERALEYLEMAPDQRPPGNNYTAWIGTLPLFDPIREDSRFQDVLNRIGLTTV